jgi:enoyl-CoA hydratase/carnithine racemase
VLTSSNPKIFNIGLDLDYVVSKGAEGGIAMIYELSQLCADLLEFPIPVIAAINGHAFAGGGVIALACDFRVMRNDRGWFCLNEIDVPLCFPV